MSNWKEKEHLVEAPIDPGNHQSNMIKAPQEKSTYGSWMLVKKPARRRTNRQQISVGHSAGTRSGPNRDGQDSESNRGAIDLERILNLVNQEMVDNQVPNQYLGFRFRAFAEIDLNVNVEGNLPKDFVTEKGEGDIHEDATIILEETEEPIIMDKDRGRTEAEMLADKENIPLQAHDTDVQLNGLQQPAAHTAQRNLDQGRNISSSSNPSFQLRTVQLSQPRRHNPNNSNRINAMDCGPTTWVRAGPGRRNESGPYNRPNTAQPLIGQIENNEGITRGDITGRSNGLGTPIGRTQQFRRGS